MVKERRTTAESQSRITVSDIISNEFSGTKDITMGSRKSPNFEFRTKIGKAIKAAQKRLTLAYESRKVATTKCHS